MVLLTMMGSKTNFGSQGIVKFGKLAVCLNFTLFTLLLVTAGMEKVPGIDESSLGFS